MINTYLIWSLLSFKEKRTFVFLLFFGIVILLLEILSIGSIFPIVYSINDNSFYEKLLFLDFLQEFFSSQKYNFPIFILVSLFIVILIKNSLMAYFFWLESKFTFETQESISKKLFVNLLNQDFSYHLEHNTAELITRIRTDSALIKEVISSLYKLLQSLIFVSGILIFLILIEPSGFAVTITIFLFSGSIFYFLTSKKYSEIGKIRQKLEILRTKKLQESFGGIKEIKTFLKNDFFIKEYENLAKIIAKPYYVKMFLGKLPAAFLEALIIFIVVILLSLLIINVNDTSKIFALLGVFGVSAIKIIPHLNTILNSLNSFRFSQDTIEFYNKIINKRIDLTPKDTFEKIKFNNKIIFKDVAFKYQNKKNFVLKDINFEIKKNDKILLTGPTGSGKSTLVDLILGLQKPSFGEILVDGVKINKTNDNWLNLLGYVPQSIYLFDDSIKNNITLKFDDKIDEKLFKKCLEISELSEFIQKLPDKEKTVIGELGSNISGGQKQRIGIARALYKNSDVIIFDEATNALDKDTEFKIFSNLEKIKEKTFIVINHRDISKMFNYKIFSINNLNLNEKN